MPSKLVFLNFIKLNSSNWISRVIIYLKYKILSIGDFIWLNILWFEEYFFDTNEYLLGKATSDNYDLKVIQVSDLHIRHLNKRLKRIAKFINSEQADLILFTGDSFDHKDNMPVFEKFIQLLDINTRKFAILGNWEIISEANINELSQIYQVYNSELLINQSIQLSIHDKLVSITGVDDFIDGNADIEIATQNYQSSDYHIILSHKPGYNDQIYEKLKGKISYDFILSGHTHGGQINLFGWTPALPKGSGKYVKGWFENEKAYVSKGIGVSDLPFRFMSNAEIAVFKLKH
jgi:predicted MPP superfamily phosphohydrolase